MPRKPVSIGPPSFPYLPHLPIVSTHDRELLAQWKSRLLAIYRLRKVVGRALGDNDQGEAYSITKVSFRQMGLGDRRG